MEITNTLTVDDPLARDHSQQLLNLIHQQIAKSNGKITFADYMELCLYSAGLGYYSAGSYKLGSGGDFTTAPEISALFSRTLAQHIKDALQQLDQGSLLEFGAGSGKMAIDILLELEQLNSLPQHYFIIEASADLRQRQEIAIDHAIPHLKYKFIWLESLPENFIGIILANEVCDAMPVHCLHFNYGDIKERYIARKTESLVWQEGELSNPQLAQRGAEIQTLIGDQHYLTEVNLAAPAWLASIAANLQQGAVFIIDYGYSEAEYYHPQRSQGTLMCYYQQQGHDDPLILQGLQDITAHVDFTTLAQTAMDNQLDVAGFQTQTDFLLAGGITELALANTALDEMALFQQATEIKQLTLPSEMGESFKVLTLSKNLDQLLMQSQLGDQRYHL